MVEGQRVIILDHMKNMAVYNIIAREIFYLLFGAIISFGALEVVWPRSVLAYIDLNWLLIGWVVSGIVVIMIRER